MAIGVATVGFTDAKLGVSATRNVTVLAEIDARLGSADWSAAVTLDVAARDLDVEPRSGGRFLDLPPAASKAKSYDAWGRALKTWLGQSQSLDLFTCRTTGVVSVPGESERDFRVRLQLVARERRDRAVEKLRAEYAPKVAALDERIRRAQQAVDREAAQASQQKLQTAVSMGATVLGALFGRKALSASTLGKATTAARGVGRTMKESQDIDRAKAALAAVQQQKADLEAQVQAEVQRLGGALDPGAEPLETISLKPKRTGLAIQLVALAWTPFWRDAEGGLTAAYR